MLRQAEGVVSVAAVVGPARRLHVGDAPGLGAEHAEERVRRHGPGADLEIVGLLQDAALIGPELLETEQE